MSTKKIASARKYTIVVKDTNLTSLKSVPATASIQPCNVGIFWSSFL